MTLTIELPPELARRLEEQASRSGQAPAEYARAVLEEKLAGAVVEVGSVYAGLPRRDPRELADLARQQGAPTAVRFEDLLGNFWPEEESADEIIATLREWRREERKGKRG
jgi:predicted transcriptional regulator